MTLIFLVFFCLCIAGIKVDFFNRDYISRNTTIQINGIFVFLVFLSHFANYLDHEFPMNFIYMNIRSFFGQLVVTTFLFYSGYGVLTSINRKKEAYIKMIPIKVIELIFDFSVAVILFLLVQSFFGRFFDPIEIILSCIGWDSVGNSNWYLFDILLLYMITYISFMVSKDRKISLSLVLIFSLVSMMFLAQYQTGTRWYNTFLCFWLGMVYAQIKPKYEKVLQKDKKKYYLITVSLVIIFLISILLRNEVLFYIIHALVFTLLINHMSMVVHIDNPVLKWLGSHIFSIYILQRIPMIIGDRLAFIDEHMFVYFIFSLVLTGVMAETFDRFVHMISKKVFVPIRMMVNEG